MDYDSFLRRHRKKPLFSPVELANQFSYRRGEIERILPHRDPLLFLDEVTGFDAALSAIVGMRHLPADDPVFEGHFHEYPVYPGTFQVETLGQLGVALRYFLEGGSCEIDACRRAPLVRASRILGAYFLEPVLPGATLTLLGIQLESDCLTSRFAGQILVDGRVACVLAGELILR